ncbi:putative invertase inhibitor [Papaver somniferum]|uniref:putative invertase inhibitor n=1 Tax=Papaver somniferum TaxID=3469 RepID=UPI000E6FDB84|nr:putative invertase inhibitor [Papaver somniferum]
MSPPTFSSLALFPIFIIFLLGSFNNHCVNGDLIVDVCKSASKSDPGLKYDFCVASLVGNPASKDADLLGLGEISLQKYLQNATSILSNIYKILEGRKQGPDPKSYARPLESCFLEYGVIINFVKVATEGFEAKDYGKANNLMRVLELVVKKLSRKVVCAQQ